MIQKNKVSIIIVVAVALVLLSNLLLTARLLPPVAHAQQANGSVPGRYITVVGEGTVSIKPDIAKTTIGVETISPSVKSASDENREVLARVLEALRAAGIVEKDMQTAGFNIYAEQVGGPGGGSQETPQVRYHVINQVQVVIRDTDAVGAVLDAAIEAGANSTYGIEFLLDDQTSVRTEARSLAVENAGNKAAELAGLADVAVGSVVSVSEVIGNSAYYAAAQAQYGLGGGGGTPVSPGELQLTVQVQVTYAIE